MVEPAIGADLRAAARLWPARRGLRVAQMAALSLYLLICIQQLGQPYIIDEAEFPFVAEAASRSGLPIYYHGELRPIDVGTWHPPLYIYMLAGWIQVFGDSVPSVRGFGVVLAPITAAFGAITVRLLVAPRLRDGAGVAFVALYLLNPLVIASALLPDIDGTVGVLSLTAGVLVVVLLVTSARPEPGHVLAAGLVLGVALSTKLTTPLGLLPLLLVALLLSPRAPLRAIRDFAFVLTLAAALFVAWWGSLAVLTTLQFSFPFQFTYDSLVSKGGSVGLADRLALLKPNRLTLFWLDPLLLVITAVGGSVALSRWRQPTARALVLVALFGLGTVALYNVITTPVFRFPKYWIAAVPAATVVAVWLVATAAGSTQLRWRWRRGSLLLLTGSALAAVGLTNVYVARASEADPTLTPLRPVVLTVLGILALAALTLSVVRLASPQRAAAFALAVAAVAAVALHGIGLSLFQRSADFSTRYYYGETGFAQAVDDVQALTPGREPVLAPKDVGYAAERPFYEDALLFGDPAALESLLVAGTTPIAVTRNDFDYSEVVYQVAFEVIRRHMDPVFARPGSGFTVWRLRPPATAVVGPQGPEGGSS